MQAGHRRGYDREEFLGRRERFEIDEIRSAAASIEEELGADGRLVLRYSGTEALARIMLEGPEQGQIEDMASRLAEVIGTALAD